MPSIAFLVPGRITALSGGSIYDRRIVEGLRSRGWTVNVCELPSPSDVEDALSSLPDGSTALVDGLIFGAIPEAACRHAPRLRLVPIVHMPLALEPGLARTDAAAREASERLALATAHLVVVTGPSTVDTLLGYGVPRDRLVLVEPGTDAAPMAEGSGGSVVHFLCVAALTPGKGHERLIRALHATTAGTWRLTCAGSTDRDPGTMDRVRMRVRSYSYEDRVTFTGELTGEALATAYTSADAFVLATDFETYGMAVAEALARGLPVISTATGAIPSLVGDDAGIVVPPGDLSALTLALNRFVSESGLRSRLRSGAIGVRSRLRNWDVAVDEFEKALARTVMIQQ